MLLARLRSSWMRIASFATLLRANAGPARNLNEQLVTDFGLTIEDYEVLLRLARTPELRMREIDSRRNRFSPQ